MKPAPHTRMIWATVVATPPRTPSASPYAPTPLFASRQHFEITEALTRTLTLIPPDLTLALALILTLTPNLTPTLTPTLTLS